MSEPVVGASRWHLNYPNEVWQIWTGSDWLDTSKPSPLTTLRAEVELCRRASVAREEGWGPDEERLKAASHAVDAYDRVLDLIDKHTREGQ